MVLAKVNKELVTLVESLGVRAVGVSGGKDGSLLSAKEAFQRQKTSAAWVKLQG